MDNRLALMTGADIPIPECQLILHQPTIKEISYMGEEDFFKAMQSILIDKSMFEKDKVDLSNASNFQIFIAIVNEPEAKEVKDLIKQFCLLLFPQAKVSFTPQSMMVMDNGEMKLIDENNFESLQRIIKLIFCMNDKKEDENPEYNIDESDQRAREIRDKILKGRQRAAQLKGDNEQSIFSVYMSMLSIALGISLLDLNQYTMYQLFDSVERYSLYSAYDLDIRARMAGAKGDKPIENWTKNIHKYYV